MLEVKIIKNIVNVKNVKHCEKDEIEYTTLLDIDLTDGVTSTFNVC